MTTPGQREPWQYRSSLCTYWDQVRVREQGVISYESTITPGQAPYDQPFTRPCSALPQCFQSLPYELLENILESAGLRVISRFSRTCQAAYSITAAIPGWRDLVIHANAALRALVETGLDDVHSLSTLSTALCSTECIGCKAFGEFLFLPTCSRCCFRCVRYNNRFTVIPAYQLEGLDPSEFTIMRSIAGHYLWGWHACNKLSQELSPSTEMVSYDEATARISKHSERPPSGNGRPMVEEDRRHPNYLSQYSKCHPGKGLKFTSWPGWGVGMGVVAFPAMQGGQRLEGAWCPGCNETMDVHASDESAERLPPEPYDELYNHKFEASSLLERVKSLGLLKRSSKPERPWWHTGEPAPPLVLYEHFRTCVYFHSVSEAIGLPYDRPPIQLNGP